jgi:hypothetical protein
MTGMTVNPSSFQDSVGESFNFRYSGTLYRILSLGIQICTRDFFKGFKSLLVMPSRYSRVIFGFLQDIQDYDIQELVGEPSV